MTSEAYPHTVSGVCPHDCPDACGIETVVEDGRAVQVCGQVNHPTTAGWLCAKVAPYLERVYHPDRLTMPLQRIGPKGSGQWREIGWEEAIAKIARQWRSCIDEYGAEAILPYSYSGTLGLVQMAVASARLWNRLGASQLQRSICMAATRAAIRATLGARMSPPYHHVLDARALIFWGQNAVSTAPHLMPFVRRAQRAGCQTVAIDPQRSRTARGVDLHIQPYPGTDLALALGVARQIVANGDHDQNWLAANTVGWPEFQRHVEQYDVATVAAICGIEAAQIVALAEILGRSQPAMIRLGDSINRNLQGGQAVRAIACLPALIGQYGTRGGGISCSTGDYFQWDDEAINRWSGCPPAARTINMNRIGATLCGDLEGAPIQSLFVFCANPMVSAPNTARVREGLLREDLFTVVHDLFMTDTARYADIVLPATSQLEHTDLHRGYGHTYLSYNHPAIDPLGQSKSNWDVMRLLAEAMGFDEPWLRETADEVIESVFSATRATVPRLTGIDVDNLRSAGHCDYAIGDEVPFANLKFATPSGKVELFVENFGDAETGALPTWQPLVDDAPPAGCSADEALHLVTPAAHHFVNSSLANLPTLRRREKAPRVWMHPNDAEARGLQNETRVVFFNRRGRCRRLLRVTEDIRPGVLMAVSGFWASDRVETTVNWTTSDQLADVAGQSVFQSNRVWIVAE